MFFSSLSGFQQLLEDWILTAFYKFSFFLSFHPFNKYVLVTNSVLVLEMTIYESLIFSPYTFILWSFLLFTLILSFLRRSQSFCDLPSTPQITDYEKTFTFLISRKLTLSSRHWVTFFWYKALAYPLLGSHSSCV